MEMEDCKKRNNVMTEIVFDEMDVLAHVVLNDSHDKHDQLAKNDVVMLL